MKGIEGMDTSLVELIDGKPYCKKHGAMNMINPNNVWRCVTTYKLKKSESGRMKFDGNNCRAGCILEE